MSKNGLELSVEVGVSMDTDPPSGNFLDVSNSDREVFLVKVPAQLAAQWASYGPEEHIGTIVFPSDASKPTNFFLPDQNTKPYPLMPRSVFKQQHVISEGTGAMSIEGRVKQSYELKVPTGQNTRAAMIVDTPALNIISYSEQRALQDVDRSNNDVSMAWAGGRTLDHRGIAEKFVARPKEEVLHDLIIMFEKQEKYLFEDINRVLQQPKPWMTEILNEYAVTETEYGKRYYKLRPEFKTN